MTQLDELAQDTDALLALEPEEVALLVLKSIVAQEKQRHVGPPNPHNFSQRFHNHPESVQRAIMEAWSWLETSGCLAQLPQHSHGFFFVTRRGHQLAERSDTAVYTRSQTLPRHLLHPAIEQKVYSSFLRGEYDSAVFEAFKQVEVAIRDAGGYDNTEIGVSLARKAFNIENGPLTDTSVVNAERQALSDLVAGALGSYKNPHSHRNVTIADASEAAEMVILASHLLKIVDARNAT
jgi:uncharacterized protein (TIGR02391 family)